MTMATNPSRSQSSATLNCRFCGEEICPHGGCWCEDRHCRTCARRRELEAEAEREAIFQREIIGPMLGLTEEDFLEDPDESEAL